VRPGERHLVAAQQPAQDLRRLGEPVDPVCSGAVLETDAPILAYGVPGSQLEFEPALAEIGKCGCLAG
jgi:hypothetical protein